MEPKDFKNALKIAPLFKSEVKAKIYLCVIKNKEITVEEIAKITEIYPSTVRESILEMYEAGILNREKEKRLDIRLGKRAYVYTAKKPSEVLVQMKADFFKKTSILMEYER